MNRLPFYIIVVLCIGTILFLVNSFKDNVSSDTDHENDSIYIDQTKEGDLVTSYTTNHTLDVIYDTSIKNQEEWEEKMIKEAKENSRKWYAGLNVTRQQSNRNSYLYEQWLESRKEWVNKFPYVPTYHPHITYSASMHDEITMEFPNADDVLLGPGNPVEKVDKYAAIEEEYRKRYNAEVAKRYYIYNHARLKNFYNNDLRYTEEFEMLHHILDEYGYGDNTTMNAFVFNALLNYNKSIFEDPNEMSHYGVAWGERMNETYKFILGHMLTDEMYMDGQPKPTKEEAKMIRERLINEIPQEGFADIDNPGFVVNTSDMHELTEGDPLLYK